MIFFAGLLFFNCLYIYGVHIATEFEYRNESRSELGADEKSKMILWRLRFLSLKYLGPFYSKPLFTCPPCMASVHSSYFFWPVIIYLQGFHSEQLFLYVLYVGVLAGVNYMVGEVIHTIKSIGYYFNNH